MRRSLRRRTVSPMEVRELRLMSIHRCLVGMRKGQWRRGTLKRHCCTDLGLRRRPMSSPPTRYLGTWWSPRCVVRFRRLCELSSRVLMT